jgi:hypothetical protein
MLNDDELKTAARVLQRAKALCESVCDLFRGRDVNATIRMSDIVNRIEAEREYVERLAINGRNA